MQPTNHTHPKISPAGVAAMVLSLALWAGFVLVASVAIAVRSQPGTTVTASPSTTSSPAAAASPPVRAVATEPTTVPPTTATPTTTEPPPPTTTPRPAPSTYIDDPVKVAAFIQIMQPKFPGASRAKLIELGHTMCDTVRAWGGNIDALLQAMAPTSDDPSLLGYTIGASVSTFCPEFDIEDLGPVTDQPNRIQFTNGKKNT